MYVGSWCSVNVICGEWASWCTCMAVCVRVGSVQSYLTIQQACLQFKRYTFWYSLLAR